VWRVSGATRGRAAAAVLAGGLVVASVVFATTARSDDDAKATHCDMGNLEACDVIAYLRPFTGTPQGPYLLERLSGPSRGPERLIELGIEVVGEVGAPGAGVAIGVQFASEASDSQRQMVLDIIRGDPEVERVDVRDES
jgi:hypothetical protein